MNVNPGKLDKRVSIIQQKKREDADGYVTAEEINVHSCWAKFSRSSGTELIKASADFGEIKCRFLIRYTEVNLSRKMIVRYSGNDYKIVYINDYEDSHEYLELWCERLTLEG